MKDVKKDGTIRWADFEAALEVNPTYSESL